MPKFRDLPAATSCDPRGALLTVRRWLPLVVILLLMGIALQQGWYRYLSLEQLAANEQALRSFVASREAVALALYAAIYVAAVALSLPGGLVLTVTGGVLFGWLTGGAVAVGAATTGASLIFLIARSALGRTLAKRAGPRLTALRAGFQRDALHYLLFLRLVPAFPFWLVNLAPALLGVRLSTFVTGTFFGIIPGTFALAVIGSGLDGALEAQRDAYRACVAQAENPGTCRLELDPSLLLSPGLLAALTALGVLALIPVATKKVMRRRDHPQTR